MTGPDRTEDDDALLEDLRSVEGLDWELLESYRRIGCTVREAAVAVAGDLLQRAEAGGGEADRRADQLLAVTGLTRAEVGEAFGLRFDEAG